MPAPAPESEPVIVSALRIFGNLVFIGTKRSKASRRLRASSNGNCQLCMTVIPVGRLRFDRLLEKDGEENMGNESEILKLRTLLGDYPNTLALKKGDVRSPEIAFDFADVKVPNTAFKDVVRHFQYDVAELAIVTYLQAKAHAKPLVLVPAVVVGALPHPYLVYNRERGKISPADLNGKASASAPIPSPLRRGFAVCCKMTSASTWTASSG